MQLILHFHSNERQRETALILVQVLKKFLVAARNSNLKALVLHKKMGTEPNSLLDAYVLLEGKNSLQLARSWTGTIRWIGTSKFSKIEKESTWFVGVSIWKNDANFQFNLSDVSFQTMRSGGAGGQHVNKVSTAVRAIHQPTKIQVSASDSRSQAKNKQLALERLELKVLEHQMNQLLSEIRNSPASAPPLNENQPIKTFRGSDFKKESTKKPIKKERQRSKIEIKKRIYNDND